jgi:hypothetical protein
VCKSPQPIVTPRQVNPLHAHILFSKHPFWISSHRCLDSKIVHFLQIFQTNYGFLLSFEEVQAVDQWLRHYVISRKAAGTISDEVSGLFNLLNPSNRTMALGISQPLTEMSTGNLPGSKVRPARKADTLNAISEPIV